jgi:hypothetical protein
MKVSEEKTPEFYRKFYEDNRVALLQYKNLRTHFNIMVANIFDEGYHVVVGDVYGADRACCEDITKKAKESWFKRLLR